MSYEPPQLANFHVFAIEVKFLLVSTTEFANSVDLDEMANDELPYLDLHCLPSSL